MREDRTEEQSCMSVIRLMLVVALITLGVIAIVGIATTSSYDQWRVENRVQATLDAQAINTAVAGTVEAYQGGE